MDHVGNEHAGFSFGFDAAKDAFTVRGWGFWSVDVARAFALKITELLRSRIGPKRLVLDMSALKPMREEGQQSFAGICRALGNLGVTSTAIITTSHLTKLQLARLATENGLVANVEWLSGSAELTRNA